MHREETGDVTLGLSAGGPLSRTETASSGLNSKPKERGGWALCFGASLSTDHCQETNKFTFCESHEKRYSNSISAVSIRT